MCIRIVWKNSVRISNSFFAFLSVNSATPQGSKKSLTSLVKKDKPFLKTSIILLCLYSMSLQVIS